MNCGLNINSQLLTFNLSEQILLQDVETPAVVVVVVGCGDGCVIGGRHGDGWLCVWKLAAKGEFLDFG